MRVDSLGYLGIASNQLAAWHRYCTEFLGLMDASADAEHLRFRMDDQSWRIAVDAGDAEDLVYLGFAAPDSEALDMIADQLSALGYEAMENEEGAKQRNVVRLMQVLDPDGLSVEIYTGATLRPETPMRSPAGVSGFVTEGQGLGHVVLYTKNLTDKLAFFQDGLGFELSDTVSMGGRFELSFLHCNPRHHTVALAPAPLDQHLNHFMLQASSMDDVGFAMDRAAKLDVPFRTTLGKHTNDRMTSFYTKTPSKFDTEFGFGAITVDDAWSVRHYEGGSVWGHQRAAG